jgi:hypothetical protein
MKSKLFPSLLLVLPALALAVSIHVFAQGFAAGISPSRFELEADPGAVIRDTVTILNPSEADAEYLFRTVDWELDDASGIQYIEDTLADGSCRPWVRLERRNVTVRAGASRNYRFEVHVPADATPGLCRFAILIEPTEAYTARIGDGELSLPIVGRYAVISYVTIGDAAAVIENLGVSRIESNGLQLPAITVRNSGTAHDRASGQVTAVDASGTRFSLVPSNFPVLPGRTERLAFLPETDTSGQSPITAQRQLQYPVRLNGRIEFGSESIEIDATID